jgi:hypothetical protein
MEFTKKFEIKMIFQEYEKGQERNSKKTTLEVSNTLSLTTQNLFSLS